LSQLVSWEDYGITISSLCSTTSGVEDEFDGMITPSFSCELLSNNETSTVERSSAIFVFLFINAVVESSSDIPTHPISHQLCKSTGMCCWSINLQ